VKVDPTKGSFSEEASRGVDGNQSVDGLRVVNKIYWISDLVHLERRNLCGES